MSEIYPDFERFVSRHTKQRQLNQQGRVLWFTGLSGSGKTTIASGLELLLNQQGYFTATLDGDNVRTGINKNLGFSDEDRAENIRRVSEIAKLFVQNGIIVLCCFISPLEQQRKMAREIVGDEDFLEIFVNTPLEICEERDIKGLYRKARAGLIKDFTGIHAPFEAPQSPSLEVKTQNRQINESVQEVYQHILKKITI